MTQVKNIIFGVLVIGVLGSLTSLADDDDEEGEHRHQARTVRRTVAVSADPIYKAECGSCHMVYPPGILPARSWIKMMGNLRDHFGENAGLDPTTSDQILKLLTENAADRSPLRRSQKISRSIPSDQSPLRFTETLYFKRQHHEVGARVWSRKSVGSRANCAACHARAEEGVFSEDEIRIPR